MKFLIIHFWEFISKQECTLCSEFTLFWNRKTPWCWKYSFFLTRKDTMKQVIATKVQIRKQMKPTVWAEFSLAPMIATLRREGIRPPIADPLDMVPRYFSGKEPKIAATPPAKKSNLIIAKFWNSKNIIKTEVLWNVY